MWLIKRCPACEGDLVKSQTYRWNYTVYFWRKPWAKWTDKSNKIYPWACMNCGRVFFYLDEKEYEKLKQEYEHKKSEIH